MTRQWVGVPETGDVKLGRFSIKVTHEKTNEVIFMEVAWASWFEKQVAAEKAKAEAERLKAARKEFASNLDTQMLKSGNDATVRADGTVLRIQWVLCSRAAVYKLVNEGDAAETLQSLGFTKLVCADGLGTYVTQDLKQ